MEQLVQNKLIDPLNYFEQIKKICLTFDCLEKIYAIGSRVRGTSTKGKWDFDILILRNEKTCLGLRKTLNEHFSNKLDEFGKMVRVDVFILPQEYLQQFLDSVPYQEL